MNSQKLDSQKYNPLTPEEERVIIHKGTERPFTGFYYKHQDTGVYQCKRCDAPLYRSTDKFDAHCGWPSFDDEIEGAVKRVPDADGHRTEIVCANCGAHLGHVFLGERYTDKNTRHCVNSISLNFKPLNFNDLHPMINTETAVFAGGCFWGVEYYFKELPGVISTKVGYTGGHIPNPTYQQVCHENTGHAEALEVIFDTSKTNFETLARLFFEIHDPTQVNRQGPDIGSQYRSAIFYNSEEQKLIVEKLISILQVKGLKVVTELTPATKFYEAEKYHQDYYGKNSKRPYCHFRVKRF
ncbi:MAG: bifunctional methionine sulfoxide reductase B/A protein [Bacteroidales bacterium]|nr:bifunctional methionine sulfoxide reductase B/A protein [Bacteroidales bacterium]